MSKMKYTKSSISSSLHLLERLANDSNKASSRWGFVAYSLVFEFRPPERAVWKILSRLSLKLDKSALLNLFLGLKMVYLLSMKYEKQTQENSP